MSELFELPAAKIVSEVVPAEIKSLETDPRHWASVMQIWHCEDGTYHLQTTYDLRGVYPTLEAARKAKQDWAEEMVASIKSGKLDFVIPKIDTCGTQTN